MYFSTQQKSIKTHLKFPLKKIAKLVALSSMSSLFLFSNNTLAQDISGVVLNKQGKPVNNALIQLNGSPQQTRTNAQGVFTFSEINAGEFELHVSAKNYSHINKQVVVGENDIAGISIMLPSSVMEVIDVHATPLHASSIESALPINVLSADELKMKQSSTLGETLKNEVGVHSSYYGPVASSPIIRGLDGPRVLITQNGLDVGDASRVGPDHVVATETSTATQIEVLRGPATLFYGSGAIGGVVNVVDNRVPTSSEDEVDYLLQYNDVANEKQAAINIQTGTENIAFHLDAFWRDAKDYKLAGEAELHDDHDGDHDDHDGDHDDHDGDHDDHDGDHDDHDGDHDDHEENNSSRLANSAVNANGVNVGLSYLFDQGFAGFSFGSMNREYGIPGHSHAGHGDEHDEDHESGEHEGEEHGDEGVYAKMKVDRFQMLSEYNFEQQFLTKVAGKFSYSDYEHQEVESDMVGTTFSNESIEARIDLLHGTTNGWKGAWTLHYKSSDFSALGEEAFTPPSKTESIAFAWLEEKHFGPVLFQLGARIEQVEMTADRTMIGFGDEHDDDHEGHDDVHEGHDDDHEATEFLATFGKQSFTPISASAGLVWDYQPGYNIGLSVALSQRAASASELFSFGPHIGTNTFEIGAMFEVHQEGDEIHIEAAQEAPTVETSFNLDLTFRKFNGDFGYVISAFYNHIDDYYYQRDTGLMYSADHAHGGEGEHEGEEGLPILIFQQNDVEMYGAEAQFVYQLTSEFKTSLIADYIRTSLVDKSGNDSLPRIPPMRLGAIVNYQAEKFDGELSISHYFEQDDVADLESTTDSYTMVDAHINYYVDGIGDDLIIYIKGQNLANENARVHSSFLKNLAPLPGRNFSLGVRGSF
jgi:iron complex outermembrane receptor protein